MMGFFDKLGEGFIPPGPCTAAQTARVVEDADPYGVGADSISARGRCGRCQVPREG